MEITSYIMNLNTIFSDAVNATIQAVAYAKIHIDWLILKTFNAEHAHNTANTDALRQLTNIILPQNQFLGGINSEAARRAPGVGNKKAIRAIRTIKKRIELRIPRISQPADRYPTFYVCAFAPVCHLL